MSNRYNKQDGIFINTNSDFGILSDLRVQKISFDSSSNTELSNFFSSIGSEEGMLVQSQSQSSKDTVIQQNQQSQQNGQNQQDNTITDDKQVGQANIASQQDSKSVSDQSSQIGDFIDSGGINEVSDTNNDSNNNPFINNNNDNNNTQSNYVSEVEVKKAEEPSATVNNSKHSVIDKMPENRNTNDLERMKSVNNSGAIQNTIDKQGVDAMLESHQKKDDKVMGDSNNDNNKKKVKIVGNTGAVKIVPTNVVNNKLDNQKITVTEKNNGKKRDENNDSTNKKENIKQETDWLIVDKDNEIEKLFVLLPPTIYRKEYKHKDNQNLPTVLYMKDYKVMFLKATYAEDIVAMNSILKKIKDVDFVDINGDTPLIWAVRLQKLQSVRFLLHKKADPYKKNKDGMNAIETALAFGNMTIIRALSTYASSIRLKDQNEQILVG